MKNLYFFFNFKHDFFYKDYEKNSETSVVIAKPVGYAPVLCVSRYNYPTTKHQVQLISRYGSCEFLVKSYDYSLKDERMLQSFFVGWQTDKLLAISSKFKLDLIIAFAENPSAKNFDFLLLMLQQSNEHSLQHGQQISLCDETDYGEFKIFCKFLFEI